MGKISINSERFAADLQAVSEIGRTPEGWSRLAYTEPERQAVSYFLSACEQIGLATRVDPIGNAYARWNGLNAEQPVILCGSHLDTVRNGGRLDGAYGVLAAVEAVRSLKEQGYIPNLHIEIAAFACEESSRFGISTVGSKAAAGLVEPDKVRRLVDRDGVVFEDAIGQWGLSVDNISQAARSDLHSYFEIHVEQGSTLEKSNKKIGIVTGIAAPTRFQVTFHGVADHSGATAMSNRHDALTAASEFILEVEQNGRNEEKYGTVATVGVCDVSPGVMNVVPGEVKLQVDVRGINTESKRRVIAGLKSKIKEIGDRRNLRYTWQELSDEEPVFMNEGLNQRIGQICESQNIAHLHMPSGAGHDAMNLVNLCPTALIFVPSRGGISHNPAEDTDIEDLWTGVSVLCEVLKMCSNIK